MVPVNTEYKIYYNNENQLLGKRRSAVELLQESKAFYVKSEIVLDRKQELKNSGHLQVAPSTAPGAPPRLLRKCGNPITCNVQQPAGTPCCWANCQDRRGF